MTITINNLVESLFKVMCTSTKPNKDERVTDNSYFKRRIQGFKAEIEFENLIAAKGKRFLEGGQFISKKLSGEAENNNSFIYTTISIDSQDDYINLYKSISLWSEVTKLFYIKIIDANWINEDFRVTKEDGSKANDSIITPIFQFYLYNKTSMNFELSPTQDFTIITSCFDISRRNPSLFKLREREKFDYFSAYPIDKLKKIYATRYFLDVILRKVSGKQIIDLDGFILNEDKIILVEVKEKEPIKPENDNSNTIKWSYGWDTRRIVWYIYLIDKTKFEFYYIVRRIDNRSSRNFEGWDSITLPNFLQGISWSNSTGGGGMESTLTAPFLLFKDFQSQI